MYHLKIKITRDDEYSDGDTPAIPLLKAEVDVRDPRDLANQVSAVADMLKEWET